MRADVRACPPGTSSSFMQKKTTQEWRCRSGDAGAVVHEQRRKHGDDAAGSGEQLRGAGDAGQGVSAGRRRQQQARPPPLPKSVRTPLAVPIRRTTSLQRTALAPFFVASRRCAHEYGSGNWGGAALNTAVCSLTTLCGLGHAALQRHVTWCIIVRRSAATAGWPDQLAATTCTRRTHNK